MRIERDADRVCASFLLERELFESGWEHSLRGRGLGRDRRRGVRALRRRARDVYEGFVPARVLHGERFDLNETETALVGRRSGREVRLGDPSAVRVDSVEAARGRADLCRPDESPRSTSLARRARCRALRRSSNNHGKEAKRKIGAGDVASTGARRHKLRARREVRVRDRAARKRGQVAARGQGAAGDAYAVVNDGEVWLRNAHIPPYPPGERARTTTRSAPESCCCTATRSSA